MNETKITGTWINAKLEQPKDHRDVLCVVQLKDGIQKIGIGSYEGERPVPYWWCNHKHHANVIYWMDLPKIPEKGA